MRGKILDYEAKTIRNKGRAEGKAEGIAEMKTQIEERTKDMLRDNMTLSPVEKYTHLPMSHIKELANDLRLL